MARVLSTGAAVTLLNLFATGLGLTHVPSCRYIPGDKGWPSHGDWARLNKTVGGRLIATNPQAHVCHTPGVDQAACDALRAPYQFHGEAPSLFVSTTCNPLYRLCELTSDNSVTRLNLSLTEWDNAPT
jgi:hypothetical protein